LEQDRGVVVSEDGSLHLTQVGQRDVHGDLPFDQGLDELVLKLVLGGRYLQFFRTQRRACEKNWEKQD
jgi:hypothetical protein